MSPLSMLCGLRRAHLYTHQPLLPYLTIVSVSAVMALT